MSDPTPTATFNYLAPLNELKPPGTPYRVSLIICTIQTASDSQYTYSPPEGNPEHNEVLVGHSFKVGRHQQ
jgi:hypothetical protein